MFARLSQVSHRLELFRFGGELVQFLGMHQSVALAAYQRSGGEFMGTALAIADEFGSDCGHGFEERRLILREARLFLRQARLFLCEAQLILCEAQRDSCGESLKGP